MNFAPTEILRHIVLVLGLLFVAVLIQGLTWYPWFEAFVLKRVYTNYGVVHVGVLVEQVPIMFTFLLLGAVGFFVFERWPLWWTLAFGTAASLFRAISTQTAFAESAELADYVNYLVTYAYPPLFALLGATAMWWALRKRSTPLTRLAQTRRTRRAR